MQVIALVPRVLTANDYKHRHAGHSAPPRWEEMASFVCDKPLAALTLPLEDRVPPPTLALSLQSLGLDGCVLDGVLTKQECQRCLEAAERTACFSFWDPAGPSEARLRTLTSTSVTAPPLSCSARWAQSDP